jgi:LysM repeat protein
MAPATLPETPSTTPTPAPTPTPTIHIVTLGETISSIALRYGLDMNALLAANPAIDPYALIVGDQVVIPAGLEQVQIGGLTEPLALDISQPECFRTPEGGLWCFAILSNPLTESASNIAVTFKVLNTSSEEVASQTVTALLNRLEPGQSLPASVYFSSPLPASFNVTANLASAFPVSQSGKTFFSVETGSPLIEISGRMAKVTGEAKPAADAGKTVDVLVAALAYDINGNLVGLRRVENRVTLEEGKGLNFNLYVYSASGVINSVIIKAEAILVK